MHPETVQWQNIRVGDLVLVIIICRSSLSAWVHMTEYTDWWMTRTERTTSLHNYLFCFLYICVYP